ncbi:hypothetical protein GGD63_002926 [Bradyrhizobium sp. cir1]|nr:hypothetical protein [Bradyrhizobium sp. cir1]
MNSTIQASETFGWARRSSLKVRRGDLAIPGHAGGRLGSRSEIKALSA